MDTLPMPSRPDLAQYVKRAEDLVNSAQSENTSALKEFCNDWLEKFVRISGPDLTDFVRGSYERAIGEVEKGAREMKEKAGKGGREFGLVDAQFLVARAHSFESWNAFAVHVDLASRETPDGAEFEVAADAVVDGDLPKLESLLIRNPALAHARSGREHRATLLYYLAANGVEDFRQRSPANAPEIARLLLDSGAEVEALCGLGQSGDTPMLALVTSVHPHNRGVATELIEIFVKAGSKVDGVNGDGAPVRLALKFGYPESAAALVRLGAEVKTVAMAAGLGMLDLTREFVEGRAVSQAELGAAFELACRFGRTDTAEYLLAQDGHRRIPSGKGRRRGRTGHVEDDRPDVGSFPGTSRYDSHDPRSRSLARIEERVRMARPCISIDAPNPGADYPRWEARP